MNTPAQSKGHTALDSQTRDLVSLLESSALEAATLILKKLEQGPDLASWRKGDATVVTEADIAAQALLVEKLRSVMPLVCEEDPTSHSLLESEDSYIVIDPLDGTTSARRFGIGTGSQVGYGPIIGLVQSGRLRAAVFINIPMRQGFSAVLGYGCESFSMQGRDVNRECLPKLEARPIEKSALLFYAGKRGELESLAKLRSSSAIENYYRFGGFANDAVRVALDYEQAQLQFSVKVWDLPAVLLPYEVGCKVVLDPLGSSSELCSYRPCLENPLLLGQPHIVDDIMQRIRAS